MHGALRTIDYIFIAVRAWLGQPVGLVGLVGVVSGDIGWQAEWQDNKMSCLGLQQTDRYSPDQ